jgi:hypothetical protein
LLTGASSYLAERIRAVDRYLALRTNADSSSSTGSSGFATPARSQADVQAASSVDIPLPKGFYWIPIGQIDQKDILTDPSEWKKGTSKAEMMTGLEVFHRDLLPVLSRGSATHEDFRRLDEQLGRTSVGAVRADSLAHLYEVFFGTDTIAVDRAPNGGFSVSSGRHRISVAKELGWTHVPARLAGAPRS